MLAVPGGLYRARLKLSGPLGTDPSWLVGGIRATWGGMEVVNMRRTGRDQVAVTLRASRRTNLDVGDTIDPITQGISVPGLETPSARVDQVEPVSLPTTRSTDPTTLGPELSDEAPTPWSVLDVGKLVLSAALITTTVLLVQRGKGSA
jgi:hypothetical protein